MELHANAAFEMSAKNTEIGGTGLILFRLVHDHRGPGMHWVGELAAGRWHSPTFPETSHCSVHVTVQKTLRDKRGHECGCRP